MNSCPRSLRVKLLPGGMLLNKATLVSIMDEAISREDVAEELSNLVKLEKQKRKSEFCLVIQFKNIIAIFFILNSQCFVWGTGHVSLQKDTDR